MIKQHYETKNSDVSSEIFHVFNRDIMSFIGYALDATGLYRVLSCMYWILLSY